MARDLSPAMIARLLEISDPGRQVKCCDRTTAALERRGLIYWWRPGYPASIGGHWALTEAGRAKLDPLEQARAACDSALQWLRRHFSADMELTLIARRPGDPECYLVVTNDDLVAVAETIGRARLEESPDEPEGAAG